MMRRPFSVLVTVLLLALAFALGWIAGDADSAPAFVETPEGHPAVQGRCARLSEADYYRWRLARAKAAGDVRAHIRATAGLARARGAPDSSSLLLCTGAPADRPSRHCIGIRHAPDDDAATIQRHQRAMLDGWELTCTVRP